MTEAVKTLFVNYAICSAIGGILEYFTPEAYRKTLRVAVVSVVLVLCISPVFEMKFDKELHFNMEKSEEQVIYDSLLHTANLTEKKVRQQIKNILIKYEVDEYEIYITTSVDKEACVVFLEKIAIEVDKAFEEQIPHIVNDIPKEYKSIVKTGVKK